MTQEWSVKTKPPRKKSILKKIIRQKVLVIPYMKSATGILRYLIVKDRVCDEYTFISGCVKKAELVQSCAVRELKEETREAVVIQLDRFQIKRFVVETVSREPEEIKKDLMKREKIITVYHVFMIDISNYKSPTELLNTFKTSKKTSKAYNENSEMTFATLDQFKTKKMWSFIRNEILSDARFLKCHKEIGGL
jgi:ADP-ribose pyrophosphatase YjhB (NUDIX family)